MSASNLVIVESPAKAKTINKYLGGDYQVLASYGHIRDLPAKDGSVRPDEDFAMDWELGDRAKKPLDAITQAAKSATRVYLATDPDREGEAISWHVQEVLGKKRGLGAVEFHRVTFHEITKQAVLDAIRNPRDVNRELVEAYLARRALDYLVGFTLSPVLWRKLPGSRSAGRVQSVALRLVCEREAEIERFRPREYWSVLADLKTAKGAAFQARLHSLDGQKLDKFALGDEAAAQAVVARIQGRDLAVTSIETKDVKRHPAAPFTTSTLQQEASRKLGMGSTATMRTAQKLYEGVDIGGETTGLITYMRTDGTQLAQDAVTRAREEIGSRYGRAYVPQSPRQYKSKQKNAQEAHEAIRPTDPARHPDQVKQYLNAAELKLYDLIYKRTLACQMESAVLNQATIDIATADGGAGLRATGSVVVFDGFLKVYEEGMDDTAEDAFSNRLPAMAEGEALAQDKITPKQHFTEPPPRYTEASLVKKMEELGIGRPSTYASILQVLQDRDYVVLDKRRFVPSDRGRLVTTFLSSFFTRYVEYDFTARLEEQLDEISGGAADWKQVLRDFWDAFSQAIGGTKDLTITQVIDALDEELGPHFFPKGADGSDPRVCPSCGDGRLGLRLSRTGAFIGCSNYPDCRYTRPLAVPGEDGDADQPYPKQLGEDPATILPVSLRKGPYGLYVQLGPKEEDGADKTEKPKRCSLPRGLAPADVDLKTALALLGLPRMVGTHPETGKEIQAGIGRFGPYLKHDGAFKSLPAGDDVLTVGMNRAMELLATARGPASAAPLKELGDHPDGGPMTVHNGRYGPYVKHKKLMASLPKGQEVDSLTAEQAIALLAAKAAKAGSSPKAGAKAAGKASKTAAKADAKAADAKPVAKKTTAKKTTAKKAPAKKKAAGKPKGTTTVDAG